MEKLTSPYSSEERNQIVKNLFNNIASSTRVFTKKYNGKTLKSMPGAVIASPDLPNPNFSQDYLFHWTRDGAIVMYEVVQLYIRCQEEEKKNLYRQTLVDYVNFVEKIQAQPEKNGISILGEPKFNIDGTLWTGQWSRPQNDGAAYQALTLLEIASIFMEENLLPEVVKKIYDQESFNGLAKVNLEYCAKVWKEKSINAWEELLGDHFSVHRLQRFALRRGAEFAAKLGDVGAARYYHEEATHLTNSLRFYWNDDLGYYYETINEQNLQGGGVATAILLSAIHARYYAVNDEFSLTSTRMLSTLFYVRGEFEFLYQINAKHRMEGKRGVLIGRYATDIYDGNFSAYGNPWFLCSHTLGHLYYRIAKKLLLSEKITICFLTKQFLNQIEFPATFSENEVIEKGHAHFDALITWLIEEGDAILRFAKQHCVTYADGSSLHMSEQINRRTGEQVSARDLSWSYSSLLVAMDERYDLIAALGQ